ncbi:copper oxidase [Mangrovactinospora gilvigrisea]|uniref:Copper oxidase n=1 Tax=Mangrovactinospora gilvigrisea TaxID=1428644 RepID=A0A1J7BI55_9ACTN|nr:copper oxidase [Mangrovactinospora gilvigrisea]
MRRRAVLGAGLAGGLGIAGLGIGFGKDIARPGQPGSLLASRAKLPAAYQVPLPIPAVARPASTAGGTDHYAITQRPANARLLPGGLVTPLWTYGGTFPGPTIVAKRGRPVTVAHRNELDRPSVVHLHGGHTPHDSDGYPIDLIMPAGMKDMGGMHDSMPGMPRMPGMTLPKGDVTQGSRTYSYPSQQRAATLWYHDHVMGFTGPGVWHGLAGFHLVTDDEEAALPLPRGDRDIPLMIADRSFAADGSFQYPAAPHGDPGVTRSWINGVLGDVVLVNGAPWPTLEVDRARYRFRILNASNARRYRLQLDPQPAGGGALVQIGSDGGLLDRPRPHDRIDIAQAERFDVVVDFSRYKPGTQVELRNLFASGGPGKVMRFTVRSTSGAADDSRVPAKLSAIEPLAAGSATVTRSFLFQRKGDGTGMGWTINGEDYHPGRTLAAPRLGRVERWRFVTDVHHPIHVHLDPFQVVARNGASPGEYDHGWKDTIDLRSAESAEVLVRFSDYSGRFLLHCHNLEHEDMGMMADFTAS